MEWNYLVCLNSPQGSGQSLSHLEIKGKRVLVTADKPTNRKILKMLLEQLEMVPVLASGDH